MGQGAGKSVQIGAPTLGKALYAYPQVRFPLLAKVPTVSTLRPIPTYRPQPTLPGRIPQSRRWSVLAGR
jgi:hypothetical protein